MQTLLKSDQIVLAEKEVKTNIKFINSRFGKLELDVNKTLFFPYGLVGLENYKDFGLVNFPKNIVENFKILQSLEDDNLSLITYICNFQKVTNLISKIDIEKCCNVFNISKQNLAVIFVTSVHNFQDENANPKQRVSINLRAPLFIDTERNIGIQYVFTDNKYSIQHDL
ncbi:MAG: flagellar assembly protein FliW [Alphaproteobacteria bacterium]